MESREGYRLLVRGFTCAIMGVCCSWQRVGLVVITMKFIYEVAILWLSASYDRVVVVREGSFPPWAAAAAARRL
eukprot:scaffold56881_cov30-Attheya_sp.AAC.1